MTRRAFEQILQVALQGGLLEQGPPLAHVDKHIEVAAGPRVATGHGPEDRHHPCAMAQRDTLDLIAATSQLLKARRRPRRARIRIAHTRRVGVAPTGRQASVGLS